MRLLVCGGREFDDVPRLWSVLDHLHGRYGITCLIEGAQEKQRERDRAVVGTDYWAHQWALARGVPHERYPADWKNLGRKAGPIRNQEQLDRAKPTHCLAMPGGTGTADMVTRAKGAGLPVREERP